MTRPNCLASAEFTAITEFQGFRVTYPDSTSTKKGDVVQIGTGDLRFWGTPRYSVS